MTSSKAARVGLTLMVVATIPAAWSAVAQQKGPAEGRGGSVVAHRAGGKRIAAPRGYAGATARWFDTGFDAGEPTIGHTEDGAMFFAAMDVEHDLARYRGPFMPDVLRSDDGGKTWAAVSPVVGPVNQHFITADPYIWVDEATGRIFNIDLTVACSYLSFSDDLGESWTTNPLACGRPVNDHQTLFGGPAASSPTIAYDHVLYYCWNDVATSSCSKSIDGGVTWHPTGTPAFHGYDPAGDDEGFNDVSGFCGGLHGHGAVGPDGSVYLPREYCSRPMLAISRDEGRTWEQVQVADIPSISQPQEGAGHPSVAVDDKGNVFYSWVSQRNRLPYLSVSRDGGETWGRPMMIGHPGLKETNLPQIDAEGNGKIAITYYGSPNSPGPPWAVEDPEEAQERNQKYTKTTWNVYVTVSANPLASRPVFLSAALNDPSDPLVRGRCGPGRCGRVYDFIDVEISPQGWAWVPFVDACIEEDYPGTEGFNCATKPVGEADYGDRGLVGALVGGPRLR